MDAWKKFEADAASLFGGRRYWANSGERLDFESDTAVGQCKLVKVCSLEALTQLAEEMDTFVSTRSVHRAAWPSEGKAGVVCVKVRRGRGKESPPLVVMTFDQFRKWNELQRSRY